MIDWLNTNSGAVQGLAAIVSVVVLLGLAVVTLHYANQTKRIAQATEEHANAAAQMEREAYAGRVAQALPHMTLEWSSVGDNQLNESVPLRIGVNGQNDGRGTAINVSWRLDWPGWGWPAVVDRRRGTKPQSFSARPTTNRRVDQRHRRQRNGVSAGSWNLEPGRWWRADFGLASNFRVAW